jgi:hypothetical protein
MGRHAIYTFGSLDANLLKPLRLFHGPYHSLDELFDLLVQASNIGVLLCRLLVDLHGLDSAIVFSGKSIQDKIRILVDTDEVAGLELFVIHESDERKEDGLTSRGLDDGGLAHAGGIQIYIGAFFRSFRLDIKIQQFHDVAHEVR